MNIKSSNLTFHILYWIFVTLVLIVTFGRSWGNGIAAFYFVAMLLPVVLGTSYTFNFWLVPHYLFKRKYFKFVLYTFYCLVISLYLQTMVVIFSVFYVVQFNLAAMGPNVFDTMLLAVVMYLIVFIGSFLLMLQQLKEKQHMISQLLDEKEKMQTPILEITSNRKKRQIPFDDIIYIESLANYIKVHTSNEEIISKEKISSLQKRLPEMFVRIHRSFIINKNHIRHSSYNEVQINEITLPIGRSYATAVKTSLNQNAQKIPT